MSPTRSTKARSAADATPSRDRALRALDLALVIAASVQLAVLAVTMALRVGYPFELELLEGAVLAGVERIAQHLPLYCAPSLTYVPLNYPPLYFIASAGMRLLLPDAFLAQRILSLLSFVAAAFLLHRLARRFGASRAAAWGALGFLALCYRAGGAWYDVGRADTMHLALLCGALLALWPAAPSPRRVVSAAALIAAAILTKQSAALTLLPVGILLAIRAPRLAWPVAASTALILSAAVLLLGAESREWIRYYLATVPSFHPLDRALTLRFPVDDLLAPFWPTLLLGALAFTQRKNVPREPAYLAAVLLGMGGIAWLLRSYVGGYANVLMPLHAALALGFALAWTRLTDKPPGRLPLATRAAFAGLLVLAQAVLLRWAPLAQIPTRADYESGVELQQNLAAAGGAVYVPTHPYLASAAGLPVQAHIMPLMDIARDGHDRVAFGLLTALRDSLRAHHWRALVLDEHDLLSDEALDAGYHPVARAFTSDSTFWPVTGTRSRPEFILYPAPDSTSLRLRTAATAR